jgi:hypothetical protein
MLTGSTPMRAISTEHMAIIAILSVPVDRRPSLLTKDAERRICGEYREADGVVSRQLASHKKTA